MDLPARKPNMNAPIEKKNLALFASNWPTTAFTFANIMGGWGAREIAGKGEEASRPALEA